MKDSHSTQNGGNSIPHETEGFPLYLFDKLAWNTSQQRLAVLREFCDERGLKSQLWEKDVSGTRITNLEVWPRPSQGGKPLRVFLAHYDVNYVQSENTIDNTAALVLLARLLEEAAFPSTADYLVVFTDGEERGGIGSQVLAKRLAEDFPGMVEYALNLDVVGHGSDVIIENVSVPLRQVLVELGGIPFRIPFNDAVLLREEGINALCLSNGNADGNNPFWSKFHSPSDNRHLLQMDDLERSYRVVKCLAEKE